MIREIIDPKTLREIFLIFCRSSFINNFIVKNYFLGPLNHRNLNFNEVNNEANPAHRFEDHIYKNKVEGIFFRKNFFQRLVAFLAAAKPLNWTTFFSAKN